MDKKNLVNENMLESIPFHHPIRVRWSEIDGQRIVFNGNYLDYIDTAMVEYFRTLGVETLKKGKANEFDYVVAHLDMDFTGPSRFDDLLLVYVTITRVGNASFDVTFYIVKEGESSPNVTIQVNYVCFDNRSKKSSPIPADIREKIQGFEPNL